MLDRVEADAGGSPGEVLADAGHCSEEELAALEERGVVAHVALGREGRKVAKIDGERRPATRRMAKRIPRCRSKTLQLNICPAEVDGGAAAGLDQGGDGIPSLRCPGLGEGEGRVGPGVPGAERKAHGDGLGGLKPAVAAAFVPNVENLPVFGDTGSFVVPALLMQTSKNVLGANS